MQPLPPLSASSPSKIRSGCTDFLQAAEQLTEAWTLQKMFEPGVLDIEDWLAAELAPGSAVGVDPALFKAATEAEYQAKWGTRLTIKHLPANLVDTIWMTRPIDPANNILIHPEALAGERSDLIPF